LTNDDYAELIKIKKPDSGEYTWNKNFKVYKEPDLSKYDNQYCIYWFKYEKDYIAPENE
jgi:hypothetical protein